MFKLSLVLFRFPAGYFCTSLEPGFSMLFIPRNIQELMALAANSKADHRSLTTAGKGKGKSCRTISLVYFLKCFKRLLWGSWVNVACACIHLQVRKNEQTKKENFDFLHSEFEHADLSFTHTFMFINFEGRWLLVSLVLCLYYSHFSIALSSGNGGLLPWERNRLCAPCG